MNRRKKINDILKKRKKQAKAKGRGNVQTGYVSKAERARLETLELENKKADNVTDSEDSASL